MRSRFFGLIGLLSVLTPAMALESRAGAVFSFHGEDEGGIGSATMEFNVSGNALTIMLDNTSPTTLLSGSGVNAPGILGFGFDLQDPSLTLLSWSLKAFDPDGDEVTLGSNSHSGPWQLGAGGATGGGHGKVSLDYYPHTNPPDGRLYNPDLAGTPGGWSDDFFTTATLVLTFSGPPELDAWVDAKKDNRGSPYVRMQQVGKKGKGSLKLVGTPVEPPTPGPNSVPEPSSMLVWAGALTALGLAMSRCRSKAAA